jgi:signal transduction histidine kinase
MQILETIAEIQAMLADEGNAELQQKLASLKEQITRLLEEKQATAERHEEVEAAFARRLRTIRHDAGQPLTTVQFFLDMLPAVLEQEHLVVSKLVNQNYWTKTYLRAQNALKTIPGILEGREAG